jgi:hypothetical protein
MGMQRVKLAFDAVAINEALAAVLDAGLLCDVCTTKTQTRTVMMQSDFCPTCQRVIQMYLGLIVERRLQEVLIQKGLSPDAVKVMNEG